jgi:hypothetical protein
MLNQLTAEHAHRLVFSAEPVYSVTKYRPRVVDSEYFKAEKSQWAKWHDTQTKAEMELMGTDK